MSLQLRVCRRIAFVAIGFLMFSTIQSYAADYPNRNPRIIVPYPPGGATDIVARLFGDWLSKRLGQQFIIENRPGGGNNIGTEAALKSPPDGYTFVLTNPANTVNASLYKKLNFNFIRDTDPVVGFIRVPNVMEVHPSVPAKTVAEFIAYVKANPGKVNMASSGNGTSIHLSGMLFMSMTGAQMTHVPYRGSAPALTDLLAGQVHVMFDNLPPSMQHIKAGTLRPLGVTTATRSAELPDLPTVAETVPGYEASAFFGLSVPKGTPRDIIELINKEVNLALKDPDIQAKLKTLGGIPIPGAPEDFGKIVASETSKWEKVVRDANLSVE
ncbi:tripartite-type tricarboxylate transporter receptor subunit TctC [Pseudorhodoplanes sinuspersici]|nr:tripartite-type tricarboxylate transporter receptor subunit TctC [Pseudorhodoplanes sinuspersici]